MRLPPCSRDSENRAANDAVREYGLPGAPVTERRGFVGHAAWQETN